MSNPAAGRRMPTCQGPGESDLARNEKDAISLKCQCSGPNVAILEYRGEPSDPPKKVCSNLLLTTNMLTCLEKLALNWVDIYGYIHALSLVGLSPLKYHANVSSTNLWTYGNCLGGPAGRLYIYASIQLSLAASAANTRCDASNFKCSPCPTRATYSHKLKTSAFLQDLIGFSLIGRRWTGMVSR